MRQGGWTTIYTLVPIALNYIQNLIFFHYHWPKTNKFLLLPELSWELQRLKMASFSMVSTPIHLYLPKKLTFPIRCSSSSSAPSVSTPPSWTQFDLKTYWTTLIADINQKLHEAVPVRYPDQIYESMRYSVLAEGAKRASPVMCVAACELFGGNRLAAFPTACALEMVRNSSSFCYTWTN